MDEMAAFRQLQAVVLAMQAAADVADWDRFLELQPLYQASAAALPSLEMASGRAAECLELVEILKEIQSALSAVIPLAQVQRTQLAGELAGIHNASRLNRTYQS